MNLEVEKRFNLELSEEEALTLASELEEIESSNPEATTRVGTELHDRIISEVEE